MKRLLCLILLPLFIFSAHARAVAQQPPTNLLRNPDAAEGVSHWRVYPGATVEESGGERAFVLRDGGYLIQKVGIPDDRAGHYALLIGRAFCENCSGGTPARTAGGGRPSLSGAMEDPGSTYEGSRIYATLQGQNMSYPRTGSGWQTVWGVFQIPVGAGTISFFIRQDGSGAARFRELGIYIFPTRHEARAFVGGKTAPGAGAATAAAATVSHAPLSAETSPPIPAAARCEGTSLKTLKLGGLRLGMSVEEVLETFPGSASDQNVLRALERTKASNGHGYSYLMISPRSYFHDPNFARVNKYWIKFLDGRVYAVDAIYEGSNWASADEFVRGMSGILSLPPVERWEKVSGIDLRYMVCEDVELRFYAAPRQSRNDDYILLADRKAERLLAERKMKAWASRSN